VRDECVASASRLFNVEFIWTWSRRDAPILPAVALAKAGGPSRQKQHTKTRQSYPSYVYCICMFSRRPNGDASTNPEFTFWSFICWWWKLMKMYCIGMASFAILWLVLESIQLVFKLVGFIKLYPWKSIAVLSLIGAYFYNPLWYVFEHKILEPKKTPNLSLEFYYDTGGLPALSYEKSVLIAQVRNHDKKVTFDSGDVWVRMLMPCEFSADKDFFKTTSDGQWSRGYRIRRFDVGGLEYCLVGDYIHSPIHPDSNTNFMVIAGDFKIGEKIRFYYYFNTPLGYYPKNLNLSNIPQITSDGGLPSTEVVF
jgi:hypothetical protein